MIKLGIYGPKLGTSLTVSVSQGALTAGPYTVPAWGVSNTGGVPVITTTRAPVYQVAPESIMFRIDHTNSTFDSAGPAGPGQYDERLHEIFYFWDFGDPGTWTAPEKYITGRNNSNAMTGHVAAHLYTAPGTYSVSCFMVEPSSGKTATATLEVEVLDPDDLYSGAGLYNATLDATVVGETVLINPNGDSDFSAGAAYSGALQVELNESGYLNTLESYVYTGNNGDPVGTKKSCDKWSWMQSGSPSGASGYQPRRYLFKRGGTYNIRLEFGAWDDCDLTFGAYGAGANPIFNLAPATLGQTTSKMFSWGAHFGGGEGRGGTAPEIRFENIDMIHAFDPTTTDVNLIGSHSAQALWPNSDLYVVISGCKFKGFGSCTMYFAAETGTPSHVHLDDCIVEDYGGQYTFYMSGTRHADSVFAATGCRSTQNPNAIAAVYDPPGSGTRYIGGYRNLMRLGVQNMIVYGCDLFHIMNNFHIVRIGDTPTADGYNINVGANVAEGGRGFAILNANLVGNIGANLNRPFVNNAVFDGNIYASSYEAQMFISIQGSGVTVRNGLFITPANLSRGGGLTGFAHITDTESDTGDTSPGYVLSSPIKIYNNTMYSARTYAQAGSPGDPVFVVQSTPNNNFTAVTHENNVMHFPAYSGAPGGAVTTFAPLSSNVLFQARNAGYTAPGTLTEAPAEPGSSPPASIDTDYATPADSIIDVAPASGSTALNAATTGNRGWFDLTGDARLTGYNAGTIDAGAWQVS